MSRHCENSDHGRGTDRDHALARMVVSRLSSVAPFLPIALDTGDADEFTFSGTGDFACFRGLSPYEQATVAVAS
ncbi:hypothetical protein [Mesorhizobium loti]|nr:hypothetical protein [Mesorhizobium loti]